jgi:hypothetical protein
MKADRTKAHIAVIGSALLALMLLAPGCQTPFRPPWAPAPSFEFALIGDAPYSVQDATNAFPNMIDEINRARLAFVVHDGDIKAGATPCTDELFEERHRQFQTFRHPFIFIFGDNEWSDCLQPKDDPRDPMERLEKLRELFTQGDESLGRRKLKLTRQSETPEFSAFRENVRWTHGNVLFVGLNIPGSANNFGHPEFPERNRANLAWLKEAFEVASRENRAGIMIIIQANPRFDLPPGNKTRAGFNDFIAQLERETIAFAKPVVLVHGDSHYFRIDKPLVGTQSKRRLENFTRVETFGNPDVHWLKVTVDPADPELFTFRQRIVKKNLIRHTPPQSSPQPK